MVIIRSLTLSLLVLAPLVAMEPAAPAQDTKVVERPFWVKSRTGEFIKAVGALSEPIPIEKTAEGKYKIIREPSQPAPKELIWKKAGIGKWVAVEQNELSKPFETPKIPALNQMPITQDLDKDSLTMLYRNRVFTEAALQAAVKKKTERLTRLQNEASQLLKKMQEAGDAEFAKKLSEEENNQNTSSGWFNWFRKLK